MSTRTCPSPAQASQRPPGTLKEKWLAVRPRFARVGRGGEQLADPVEGLEVGDGVRAGRAADRRLVDHHRPRPRTRRPRRRRAPRAARSQRPLPLQQRAQSTSCTSVDLPEPETPVTHVKAPSGILTSIPLRLWARAPPHDEREAVARAGASGGRRSQVPAQVLAGEAAPVPSSSGKLPWNTTRPPCSPAPGPRSTMWSAARHDRGVVLHDAAPCSPGRAGPCRMPISRSVSRGCRPTDGSSRT